MAFEQLGQFGLAGKLIEAATATEQFIQCLRTAQQQQTEQRVLAGV